jgi:glycogenin
MASPYAFVSLLTSDSYLPGALTLAAALKDIHPSPPVPPEVDFQTVCLVTPETVDISSIKLLRKAFDLVIGVEVIQEDNERGLQLLGEYPPRGPPFLSLPPLSVLHFGPWAPRIQKI